MSEIDKIKNGYWSYSPAGIPISWCVLDILPDQNYRGRFTAWLANFGGRQAVVAFYIESRYREAGCIPTMVNLEDWCQHAEGTSPELSASANAVRRDYITAQEWISSEQQANQKNKEEQLASSSDAARIKQEIAAKNLPRGKDANLALIRATLQRVGPRRLPEKIVDSKCGNIKGTDHFVMTDSVLFVKVTRGHRQRRVPSMNLDRFKHSVGILRQQRVPQPMRRRMHQSINHKVITAFKLNVCCTVDGPTQCTDNRIIRHQHWHAVSCSDQRCLWSTDKCITVRQDST